MLLKVELNVFPNNTHKILWLKHLLKLGSFEMNKLKATIKMQNMELKMRTILYLDTSKRHPKIYFRIKMNK